MRRPPLRRLSLLALLCAGCPDMKTAVPSGSAAPTTSADAESEAPETAATQVELDALAATIDAAPGEVESEELRALLRDHWSDQLERDPFFATALGVHAHDHRIPARGPEATKARVAAAQSLLSRARALKRETLGERDRRTVELFDAELAGDLAASNCRFELWGLSARNNPLTEYNYLPELHPFRDQRDAERFLERVAALPAAIDGDRENLALGAAEGLFADAESTRRVLEMLDRQLAAPVASWPLAAPAKELEASLRPADFETRLQGLLESGVAPALARYRDLVRDELLPRARREGAPGLAGLPLGEACYAGLVQRFTTLPRPADEIHEIGLREIARINDEMRALGKKRFGTGKLDDLLHKLRNDEALFFDDAAQVEQAAREALAEAKAAMPDFFGRLPVADCVVTPIPDYEAPYTTIAYYRQPHADGSKPGEYFINLHDPQSRPRYEARALAVHESIPGHHLQIAIAQELEGLPAFRKHGGMTVFVEGWGLYTERLAEEMGLYRDELDRLGMLSFDAWRASRLVVDTGLHARGWSRERAVKFMLEHTALAPNNIDNEVDRYITTPGQALAYKTGQLEIWRLRREAEAALGERFDLRDFHDVVLGGGAVTLGVLEDQVQAWVESR